MYLKEDSLFISEGAVSGYNYTTLYDDNNNDYVNTQIDSVEIEPDKKCLFYTFFFGIIGYLVYYIFKDTI
jgi:hypothetical protein